jgi:hypothetical protein
MGRLNTSLCRKVTTEYTHGDAKFLLDTPTLIASCPARTRWLVSMTHKYSGPIFSEYFLFVFAPLDEKTPLGA